MRDICQNCNAQKWEKESSGPCCSNGKVSPLFIEEPLLFLKQLLKENIKAVKHFRSNLNKYISSFQMTSLGTEHNLTNQAFHTTLKIQGKCYHKTVGPLPLPEVEPKFVQVYFMGDTMRRQSNGTACWLRRANEHRY